MSDLLVRRATLNDYPQLMQLIDGVFNASKPTKFIDHYPHLYGDPLVATRESYLACDGNRLVGHVGIYPIRLRVGNGIELLAGGIGAVATDPEYRGRGVMSDMLAAAVAGMRAAGYDLSVLWGDRMRYMRFGWETVGRRLDWWLDPRLLRQSDTRPMQMVPFHPDKHLAALVDAWNSDSIGTLQSAPMMAGIMRRAPWTTLVAADWNGSGPLPFVTYQSAERRIIVNKLIAPADRIAAILLHLQEIKGPENDSVSVRCPAGEHPLAQLGIQLNAWMTQTTTCHARMINPQSLSAKLRTDIAADADSCATMRRLFGTPADAGNGCFPLHIEGVAMV